VLHRFDIEGLRALAVLAVIAYHLEVPGISGGYVGVDVFFVISGFLITSLLIAERTRTSRVALGAFYARRIRRLLPISSVVLLATALCGAVLMNPLQWPDLAREIAASALFVSNLEFASQGTDYLASTEMPSPVQHYWSLSVEEQFYLLWPALIVIGTYRARSVRGRVAGIMTVVITLSFSASALLTSSQAAWSYFGLHTRAWELGLGAALAAASPLLSQIPRLLASSMTAIGLIGIGIAVTTFSQVTVFPGVAAALPVVATAMVLAAGSRSQTEKPTGVQRLLNMRWLQLIGARSYSLYLWHWPVIIFGKIALARYFPNSTWGPITALGALALTLALSELGFRLIENPIRFSTTLARIPQRSYILGAGAMVLVLSSAVVLTTYRNDLTTGAIAAELPSVPLQPTPEPIPQSTPQSIPQQTPQPPPALIPIDMRDTAPLPAAVQTLSNSVLPDNLQPQLRSAKGDVGTAYTSGCQQYFAVTVRTDCIFGDPNGQYTMALWGDSHASQWFAALDQIARDRNWRLLLVTQGGCPVIDVITYNRQAGQMFTHCRPWRASVRDYMRNENVSLVVLTQYYALLAADGQGAIPASAWSEHLPELLDSLRADGIEPVIMGDTPDPSEATPVCLAANRFSIPVCNPGRGVRADRLQRVTAAITDVIDPRDVSLIRPDRWLCVEDQCPTVIGNLLVYRDEHHLSNTIVRWLTPAVEAMLGPLLDALAARVDATP
jgi:peptidoglycan/LPS O-acetylase OafA/YrhL